MTAQVRRFESHRCKGGHRRAKRVEMLREQPAVAQPQVPFWQGKHCEWSTSETAVAATGIGKMAAQKKTATMKVVTFRPMVFSPFFAVRAFD